MEVGRNTLQEYQEMGATPDMPLQPTSLTLGG